MKAIVAMDFNRGIGKDGKLPWPMLKSDMKFFRKMTEGNNIVVGRITFEHLDVSKFKNRTIWVLSKQTKLPDTTFNPETNVRVIWADDIHTVLGIPSDKQIWLCGGSSLYKQYLPWCEELYLTTISQIYPCDSFLPPFEHLFEKVEILEKNSSTETSKWVRLWDNDL